MWQFVASFKQFIRKHVPGNWFLCQEYCYVSWMSWVLLSESLAVHVTVALTLIFTSLHLINLVTALQLRSSYCVLIVIIILLHAFAVLDCDQSSYCHMQFGNLYTSD